MTIYIVQTWTGKKWATVERFRSRADAEKKAAEVGGRVVEAYRSTISL